MDIDVLGILGQRDKPLKRADVERLLHEVGSSNKLNLSGQNMTGIDLAEFMLIGADLSGADLSGADLSKANLYLADLRGAKLRGTDLSKADLSKANLSFTDLSKAIMSELERKQLRNSGVIGLDDQYVETASSASTLRIRIIEEPLTPYNLTTIISALTELSTKYWLIANGRLADLIEYAQTHNVRFAEEAGLVITRITYNSPLDITLGSPNFDPKNIADALFTRLTELCSERRGLKKQSLKIRQKHKRSILPSRKRNRSRRWLHLNARNRRLS